MKNEEELKIYSTTLENKPDKSSCMPPMFKMSIINLGSVSPGPAPPGHVALWFDFTSDTLKLTDEYGLISTVISTTPPPYPQLLRVK